MRRDLNPASHDEDWIGNNAAFRCGNCNRVYVVSGFLHPRERLCPFCEATAAHVDGSRGDGGSAWIETI